MAEISHISRHMSGASKSSTSSGRISTATISRKWIDALFVKFAAIWPRDWADKCRLSGNTDALAAEWAEGCAGMSPQAMREAVEHCRATLRWAPSIAEFRAAAKAGMSDEQRAFYARAAAELPALPSRTWTERRAEGMAHLRELRERLGG